MLFQVGMPYKSRNGAHRCVDNATPTLYTISYFLFNSLLLEHLVGILASLVQGGELGYGLGTILGIGNTEPL